MKFLIALITIISVTGKLYAATGLQCEYSETLLSGSRQDGHSLSIENIDSVPKVKINSNTNSNISGLVDTSDGNFTVEIQRQLPDGHVIHSGQSNASLAPNQQISADLQVEEIVYKLVCSLK